MAKRNEDNKRGRIFAAWHGRCAYCDGPADTMDHAVPSSTWGSFPDTFGSPHGHHNLVPACAPCNTAKRNRHYRTFLRKRPGVLDRLERYLDLMRAAERRRLAAEAIPRSAGTADFSLGARLRGVIGQK